MDSSDPDDYPSSLKEGESLSHDELMDIVNRLGEMDNEEKESLRESSLGKGGINGGGDGGAEFLEAKPDGSGAKQFVVLFSMIVLLSCVFAFFCYHLFNLLKERDRKRKNRRREVKNKSSRKKIK